MSRGRPGIYAGDAGVRILAKVCMHARRGRSKTDCFRLVGVHPDTGFEWLRKGKAGQLVKNEGGSEDILVRFARVFERCVASFSAQQLAMIEGAAQSGAPNTWQAAAWLLERRDPESFGRRDKTEISGPGGAPALQQVNQVILIDPSAREASRALLRRVTGLSTDEPLGIGMGGESEEEYLAGGEPVVVDSR